jgi:DNA-binding NtrC family response regulator
VACGGTFFLDEVGETSPAIQVKLLRVLQEREIIPVGGTRPIKVDVRLIAATNADLEENVKNGDFRADLYYRLNVIPIRIPPLRKRQSDIPLLVDHFLKKASEKTGQKKSISKKAMDLMVEYDWPGNVRELENIVERAIVLQEGNRINPHDLPDKIRFHSRSSRNIVLDDTQMTLQELEKEYVISVLDETGWQKKKASEILGINASTLYRKIQRYGLKREKETVE